MRRGRGEEGRRGGEEKGRGRKGEGKKRGGEEKGSNCE